MKYSVHSKMMEDLTPSSLRVIRHPFLCQVLRGATWVIAPVAYLGLLIAPSVVLGILFQILHEHEMSPVVHWLMIGLMDVFVFWMFYGLGKASYKSLRERVIDLEAIVGFLGVALAVCIILWFYTTK